jgi:hypothetical protein
MVELDTIVLDRWRVVVWILTFAVLQVGREDRGVKGRLRIVEESLLLVGGHSVQTAEGQSYKAIVVAVRGE